MPKLLNRSLVALIGILSLVPSVNAKAEGAPAKERSTFCRFVKERSDDFAWENDLIAFRVYGPALRKGGEDSGIDCWAKRVPYPIIDRWYHLHLKEKQSYHQDRGEGADFYHVGSSRGCGGTAIWHNGGMVLSNVYHDWRIVTQSPEESVFVLTYEYDLEGRKIREEKTITIKLGERLFRSESTFTEDGNPADLEIAIGLTTHDGKGAATLDRNGGWMLVWESFKNHGELGTGVVLPPARIIGMEEIESKQRDKSHAVALTKTDATGRTVHYAGYGWSQAQEITTKEQWAAYLTQFAAALPQD